MNARAELPQAREVCPTTTGRLLAAGALLVDVRELAEVAQLAFDVPGVVLLPLSELEQRFAELPRDRELVLACQAGQRSLKATYYLMFQGYTRVANLQGGIPRWAAKGFPMRAALPTAAAPAGGSCCAAPAAESSPCCGTPATRTMVQQASASAELPPPAPPKACSASRPTCVVPRPWTASSPKRGARAVGG